MSQTTIQTIGLTDNAVTTTKIADNQVTIDKINFANALVPIGGIIMWSGTIENIPTGWALCNDQTVNGIKTPDLRNKFVVGAHSGAGTGTVLTAGPGFNADNGTLSSDYTPGNSGGETAHQLSIPELASHTHTLVPNLEVPQNSAPGMTVQNGILQGDGGNLRTHVIIQDPSPIVTTVGGNKFHENRPPYYALAFIMRIS